MNNRGTRDASRALVERLAGHPGIGESSRRATLTVAEVPTWRIAEALPLGSDEYALALERGCEDATATVYLHDRAKAAHEPWDPEVHVVSCTSLDARLWLLDAGSQDATIEACQQAWRTA